MQKDAGRADTRGGQPAPGSRRCHGPRGLYFSGCRELEPQTELRGCRLSPRTASHHQNPVTLESSPGTQRPLPVKPCGRGCCRLLPSTPVQKHSCPGPQAQQCPALSRAPQQSTDDNPWAAEAASRAGPGQQEIPVATACMSLPENQALFPHPGVLRPAPPGPAKVLEDEPCVARCSHTHTEGFLFVKVSCSARPWIFR